MLLNKMRKSYNAKLIIIFSLLNFAGVIFSGVMYYFMLEDVIHTNYNAVVEDSGKQLQNEINRRMDEVQRISHTFIFDQTLHINLRRSLEGYERQLLLNDYLLHKGNTSLVLSDMNTAIKIYVHNTSIPEYYYTSEESGQKKFEVLHSNKIENEQYYKDLQNLKGFEVWKQVGDDAKRSEISLLVRLIDFSTMKDDGVLRITVSLNEMFGDVFPSTSHQNTYYKISDESGNSFYTNRDDITEECFEINNQLSNKFITTLKMPYSNINKGINALLTKLNLILCGCFFITFLIALIFSHVLYSNVNKIVYGIKEFKKGNYKYDIEVSGGDEFSQIATSL
ncbi:MAG: hypothetical protein RR957_03200, partial [Oscillospiraceae bacterium]